MKKAKDIDPQAEAPSGGGFLVQAGISTELLQEVFAPGRLASHCHRTAISGNVNALATNGVDEASRATSSKYGNWLVNFVPTTPHAGN
jgi:hypothetical protein